MNLSQQTLDAMSSTLRVFEKNPYKLTEEQIVEILNNLRSGGKVGPGGLLLTIGVQSLLLSGAARRAAEALLERMIKIPMRTQNKRELDFMSASLEVALFESYREADSLFFDIVSELLPVLRRELEFTSAHIKRSEAEGRSNVESMAATLFETVRVLLVPLLDTEHQPEVARIIISFFDLIERTGVRNLNLSALSTLLRRCFVSPRTAFDLSILSELRTKAQQIAILCVEMNPTFSPLERPSDRALAFRHLLIADQVGLQHATLRALLVEAKRLNTIDAWNMVANCACWTQETALDNDIIILSEEIYKAIGKPPTTHQYLAICTRFGDRQRGETWIASNLSKPATVASRYREAQFFRTFGDIEKCLSHASKPLSVYGRGFSQSTKISLVAKRSLLRGVSFLRRRVLRQSGVKPYGSHQLPSVSAQVLYGLIRVTQEAMFQKELSLSISTCALAQKHIPERERSDVTLLLAPNHIQFLAQLPVAAIELARASGAEIVNIVQGMYQSSRALSVAAAVMDGVLVPPFYFARDHQSHAVSPDWNINKEKREFIYKGTNFYAGIHNSLGIIFRRFTIDFDDSLVKAQLNRHLVMFQSIHDIFFRFIELSEPSRQYRFVVVGIQYGVGYALRTLVNQVDMPNVRIIHASNGYEAFDSAWRVDPEGSNFVASYHSITDMTDIPNTPLGFRPTPADCAEPLFETEDKYMQNATVKAYVDKVDSRYMQAKPSVETGGKRRILLLGTILPDLSIPQDHGFVHRDIADWLHHTVEIANRSDDITLVVKQHPAELNQKIGFYVSERFVDLLPEDLKSVEILPYDVGLYDALMSADLVVMWSGTTALELALIGKPYMCCSRFAQEEYPLYAPEPSSLSDYEDVILGRKAVVLRKDVRLRAIDTIYRTSTSPIREFSLWPKRQLLNAQTWPARIDSGAIAESMTDPGTVRLAQRLLGEI